MEANNILFRCSSLGHIMTEPRSKSEVLSETCKTHLVDKFISEKYKRQTDIHNKYTTKGLLVEEDSLTLYSRFKKQFYKKNEKHLKNEYIMGTPDIIAPNLIDIKSSWDIYTFFRTTGKLNKMYYWQLQGYMALTGAETATLAYCLINTPDCLISDEKRKLMWRMNVISDEDKLYEEACYQLDLLMIYDDIPLEERVIEIEIPRNDSHIEWIYQRVQDCRDYMNVHLFKTDKLIEI